jgi:hypothetical protein
MVITAPLTSPMDEAPHSDRDPEPQDEFGAGQGATAGPAFRASAHPTIRCTTSYHHPMYHLLSLRIIAPLIIAYHCASILAFARAYFAVIKTAGLL